MKKLKFFIPLVVLSAFSLTGCEVSDWFSSVFNSQTTESGENLDFSNDVLGTGVTVEVEATPDEPVVENSGEFSLTTSDGTFEQVGSLYTITAGGTYKVSGVLEDGQIFVNAGDEDEVVLELSGATISCSSDSPIKAMNAGKLEISAKKNTSNAIYDNRSAKSVDDDSQGAGAVYAKCDLKLKGTGTLVVKGNYNNGLHTTKDLTIQKETLYVYGYNNGIKGNDSVTIVSGAVTAVAHTGNGIKSENTDVSSKGKQRGSINLNGGSILVDSLCDAVEAAYDVVINETNDDSVSTSITLKTGAYCQNSSGYNKNTINSSKGLKAENTISVEAGTVVIQASDDSVHANYGTVFESGGTGLGNISISGGSISTASGDDGIHADNTLTISSGEVLITNSYEGLEATHIVIEGGSTRLYATDDGMNAAQKVSGQTPSIVVSGGFVDISIATGDTDGIDSNGNFTQTGGVVISRGSPNTASGMSTGLDCDGTASITGGTFIAFNGMEKQPSVATGMVKAYYGSSSQGGGQGGPGGGPGGGGHRAESSYASKFQSGTYSLSGGSFYQEFYNQFTYSTFIVYSSEMSTGTVYSLNNGDSTILSWTQSAQTQQIS